MLCCVGFVLCCVGFAHCDAGVEPTAAQIPYLASIGNHDPPADFAARFSFPGGGAATGNRRWSIDVGPVHLVAVDTELVWGGLSQDVLDQYAWLESDLTRADANRAAVPWIVVHGHRPMCVITVLCIAEDSLAPLMNSS